MSKRRQRRFTADQKAKILRNHLVDKKPVSDVCDEEKIRPSLFYEWQRQGLANLAAAFDVKGQRGPISSREAELESKIKALEAKLAKKDNVIAEVTGEMVSLKKKCGDL